MKLMTWNIQWGLGVEVADGAKCDLAAVCEVIRVSSPDVVCLQEVCRRFPDTTGRDDDQCAQLAEMLEGYHATFGAAVDYVGAGDDRRQFGNVVLSRRAPLYVRRHALPFPFDPGTRVIQRSALEVCLDQPGLGRIGIVNVHLEYGSSLHRRRQLDMVAGIVKERIDLFRALSTAGEADGAFPPEGPFTQFARFPTCHDWIVTGDFNCAPESPELAAMSQIGLQDAWSVLRSEADHAPTFRVHVREPETVPVNFDRFYVGPDVAARVGNCDVQAWVKASDHQPVTLTIY